MKEEKKPFHVTVAENLIKQLKAGTAPWQKPWEPGSPGFMPINPTTGKRYKGINAFNLMLQGYNDNRWMTYKQATAIGAQVRKGEKGTLVQYWKFTEEQNKVDDKGKPVLDEQGKPVKVTVQLERPHVFFATVFNGEQIDGMPPLLKQKKQTWDGIERAEQILKASGADIRHSEQDRAFYRPATDSIHLPNKEQFLTANNYYAVALHELGHWTGHSSRLDRDIIHPFGSEGYAKEELKAECFSLIMGDELGIGHNPEQHAAYVGSWIKVLQNDPLEIFRAASDAEKMSNYVLNFEQKLVQEQDQTQTQKLENSLEQIKEVKMQLPSNNQQISDHLLSTLSQENSQAIVRVANERRRLSVGEISAQVFEETTQEVLGFNLPSDWNGAVQVQSKVTVENDREHIQLWGIYVQNENGMYQLVANLNNQSQANELVNLLELVDALSESNEHEQTTKLLRLNEVRVRQDPNSTDDEISAAKEARKIAEANAIIEDNNKQYITEHQQQIYQAKDKQTELNKHERTYINVPYRERNEAKKLGACWDRQQQSWYVPSGIDKDLFVKWSPKTNQKAIKQDSTNQTVNPKKQYLAVPYNDRIAAKSAGAQWDNIAKSWYVGPQGDMKRLSRWIPDNVEIHQEPAMSPREEFAESMRSLGLVINGEHPIMDGEKHRIAVQDDKNGEKSGFYVGHLDGLPAGYICNNRSGVSMKWKSKGYSLDPTEKAKLQAEAAEKIAARTAKLEQTQKNTAERIIKQMANLIPVTEQTTYMQNKGIKVYPGVLTDTEGKKTYIPAYDENGKQWTMQYIQEDGTKRFAKDSRKEGCFHIVGGNLKSLEAAPALVIQEGYATAATNAEALGFVTVAAFDSGNLSIVAKVLHDKFPDKPVIIFGDNDKHQMLTNGTNPGKTKAEEAAKLVNGKAVFPIFAPGESEYPTNLAPITPQIYMKHLQAKRDLETAPEERKADLQKALLSKEQLDALNYMKKHTDFNDLSMRSSLGREGVKRQVITAVEKIVQETKHIRNQMIAAQQVNKDQQVYKQKKSNRISY